MYCYVTEETPGKSNTTFVDDIWRNHICGNRCVDIGYFDNTEKTVR